MDGPVTSSVSPLVWIRCLNSHRIKSIWVP